MNREEENYLFQKYMLNEYLPDYRKNKEIKLENLDDLMHLMSDIINLYCLNFEVYNPEHLKYCLIKYTYYQIYIKSLINLGHKKKSYIRKSTFVRKYMQDRLDIDIDTGYRYLYRNLDKVESIDEEKNLIDFQLPYNAYRLNNFRNNIGFKKKVIKKIFMNDYRTICIKRLEDFYKDFLSFISNSDEEYKNISEYFIELNYPYLSIVNIIEKIKSLNIKDEEEYISSLYDLLLILDCPDMDLRIEALKLYSPDCKREFIYETLYINTVIFNIIGYFIDIFVNSLDVNKLDRLTKIDIDSFSEFKILNFVNKHISEDRDISEDKDIYNNFEIFKHIASLNIHIREKDRIKNIIGLDFQNKKDSYKCDSISNVYKKSKLNEDVNFLTKEYLYTKNIITEMYTE